ncbi:MAG: 2,3-bisphosphoglycerate-independent phosphoglycerate mutase [Xanthomonadales bacterium]|nr:2,3-bisphosphoglycerate-independent phosphoglycerate mutase [Xanthomonadales bacterium]
MRRRCVLLLIDGLGDLPVDALGGLTPLEAAATPNLDRLAGRGHYGLLDPVGVGEVPNTHSGSGMLFGVFPSDTDRLTRGPVEASGAGRSLQAGEIAVRANFATLEHHTEGWLVRDRRAGRISEGTEELAEALGEVELGDGVYASLQPTDQHRCVLVLGGPGLDPSISDTDPGDQGGSSLLRRCKPLRPEAERTAGKINRFVELALARLEDHPVNRKRRAAGLLPANGIITRGAGAAFQLDNVLRERGIRTAVIAGCNTVRGLARILGFTAVSDPRFTATVETDLEAKVAAALQALESHDLVFVHVKAPDLLAHDRKPRGKRDFLERLDLALSPLEAAGVIVGLTADHTTDSNSGTHTSDPVPTLLYVPPGSAGMGESVQFGERSCRRGNLPRQSSHEFVLRVAELMGF